jgi:tetratricopeptide (TPR) repeat protein
MKKPVKNRKAILYPTMILLAMVTFYGYSMIVFEAQVRKTRNAMGSERWNLMLQYAKAIPTTFRTLDAEAVPVKSYEGQAYSKLKRLKESRDAYLEALKAHPTKISVMNNLGKVYYEMGDYKAAKKMFLTALEILPDYKESLINLSTTYYKTGQYNKTLKTLQRIPPEKRDKTVKKNLRVIKRIIRKQKREQNTKQKKGK